MMDSETVAVAKPCEEPSAETNKTIFEEFDEKVQEKDVKELEVSKTTSGTNESEYETVDESDSEQEQDIKQRTSSACSGTNSHNSSEANLILEREEGDGQESAPTKKVDDDEDKKNPQYIPKRGTFYEHDDRTADDIENPEVAEAEKDGKKKVWQDKKERWTHDKYNDNEQTPKSRSELIAIYGYDIRNEDGPPRARRRRRYGRGPNKYTRNWEDEDAYNSKPPLSRPKPKPLRKPRNQEEFPPLGNTMVKDENSFVSSSGEFQQTKSPVRNKDHNQQEDGHSPVANTSAVNQERRNPWNSTEKQNGKPQQRVGTGRIVKPIKEIKDSDYKGFTISRQYKSSKTGQKIVPKKFTKEDPNYIQSQNYTNKSNQQLESEMSKLNIQDPAGHKSNSSRHGGQRQASVPPRLQAEQKASKRYSSLRQRSLPETAAPPFNQHQTGYYGNDYNQQNQQQLHQNNTIHPSSQVPQIPPPPIPSISQQVPTVSAAPILQAPPQYAAPFGQAPPPFLQPNVAPPPFMPQQTPPIINYAQAQFPQAPFQGFQQPFNPVNQPTELYQPQGGITYYSPQEQQVAQRAAPQKRPKAAIPIVPPPPEPRGRGRGLIQPDTLNNVDPDGVVESKMFENSSNSQFDDAVANE